MFHEASSRMSRNIKKIQAERERVCVGEYRTGLGKYWFVNLLKRFTWTTSRTRFLEFYMTFFLSQAPDDGDDDHRSICFSDRKKNS